MPSPKAPAVDRAKATKSSKTAKPAKRVSLTRPDDVGDEPAGGDRGIPIITYGPPAAPHAAGKFVAGDFLEGERTGWFARRATVSPETLQANLKKFLASMTTAMEGIPATLAGFELDEIELSLEIGAEGEIGLLGTGGKVSGTGSISLTLKRPAEKKG